MLKNCLILLLIVQVKTIITLDYESNNKLYAEITSLFNPNQTQIPLCFLDELKCCQLIQLESYPYICNKCDNYCPCLCKSKGNAFAGSIIPSAPNQQQQQQQIKPSQMSISSDISFSAYTLILSIGLPSITIILIICTLLSITYCCKSTTTSNDNDNINNNNPPLSVSNISLVYINLDENEKNSSKEQPPKYSDYVNGGVIDKLPSYQSFRNNTKKMNETGLNTEK